MWPEPSEIVSLMPHILSQKLNWSSKQLIQNLNFRPILGLSMGLKNFQQLEQGSANRMQAVARDNT